MRTVLNKKSIFNRDYFFLIAGRAFSFFGDGVHFIVVNWFIYVSTQSIFNVGIIQIVSIVISTLMTPYLGYIVDRFSRRKLIISADIMRFLCLLIVIAVIHFYPDLTILALFIVTAALSLFRVLFNISFISYIPELIEKENLTRFNSLMVTFSQIGYLTGSAFAGFFLLSMSFSASLSFDLFSYVFSAISIVLVRKTVQAKQTTTHESFSSKMFIGFSYLKRNKNVLLIAILGISPLVAWINVLEPAYVKNVLGLDSKDFGIIDAAFGLGAMIGGILITHYDRNRKFRYPWYGFMFVAILVLALAHSKYLLLVIFINALIGFGNVGVNIFYVSELQRVVPNEILGSVSAIYRLISNLFIATSVFLLSWIADYIGSKDTLTIVSIVLLPLCFISFYSNSLSDNE